MKYLKKLVNKVTANKSNSQPSYQQFLLADNDQEHGSTPKPTPTGFFAVYAGENRERFVVQTSFLSHPLIKMLLEKASNEFGLEQRNGLVVPFSVSTFEDISSAVESSSRKFDFGKSVEDFI